MPHSYNTAPAFSGIDINGGGVPVAVLTYTTTASVPVFFTPMLMLENLDATAANITVDVMLAYTMSNFTKFYTSGAVAKPDNASTIFVWTFPDGVIPFLKAASSTIEIRVYSDNASDAAGVTGNVWLQKAASPANYEFETKVSTATTTAIVLSPTDSFQETNDWYINRLLEITDADTGTSQVKRIIAQTGSTVTVEDAFDFTPASGDVAKLIINGYGDIGTVNGAQPMSTSDIVTAMEAVGRLLYEINALTEAGGDGDLAVIKSKILNRFSN